MVVFKKALFSLFFLGLLAASLILFKPYLDSYGTLFNFSLDSLKNLIIFASTLILTSFFFVLFGTLSQDWKFVSPIILLSGGISYLLFPNLQGIILLIGIILILILTFALLNNKLQTYITFDPTTLLTPSIKTLTTFLIILLSFVYYLSINEQISKNGFEIPDELVEQSLKLMQPPNVNPNVQGTKYLAQITPEQLELLRQNPDLLRQYGVDERMLNAVEQQIRSQPNSTSPKTPGTTSSKPANSSASPINPLNNDLIKNMIKSQFENMIKPYQSFIAPALAILFFISLTSITSLLSILLNPLLLFIFYLFKKTGFIRFDSEMRQIQKLVV